MKFVIQILRVTCGTKIFVDNADCQNDFPIASVLGHKNY